MYNDKPVSTEILETEETTERAWWISWEKRMRKLVENPEVTTEQVYNSIPFGD